MRHSVNSHHDGDAYRAHAVAPLYGDHGAFTTGLASSWSLTDNLTDAMDRPVTVNYGCFDPPPSTPAGNFLSARGVYHGVGELRYCPPSRHNDVLDATPPYFVADRRLPPEVVDRATDGVFAGVSMSGISSPPDDRDCSMRAVLVAGDTLMRTPATLAPAPSMFSWHPSQTSCSSSMADPVHRFPSTYYSNMVVDQPSCRSPVGADPAVEMCEKVMYNSAMSANTVRQLPRETRRRAAERGGNTTTLTRRPRTNFTSEQVHGLRQCFADCQYIDVHQRAKISATLGLTETQDQQFLNHFFLRVLRVIQVKVWFQNQRSKMKRHQRTSDNMTSLHSPDSYLLSHQQQQVFAATVVKDTRNDVDK